MLRVPRRLIALACAAVVSVAVSALLLPSTASAASLIQVTNFGTNPSNLGMYVYRPDTAPARPAVVVAVHYCTGSGPAFFSGSGLAPLADRYGFIVIFPSSTNADKCFDVSSPAALRRGGGSDPVGIMSMVSYAEQNYNADPNRVYAMGVSSGAMMTNVLLGDYPDVFKAGAAFAGVPFGCFASANSRWNSDCAGGLITKTAAQWGDLVRAADPGYAGARPRMQLWHGTADETLNYHNFGEEIKQWTNVLGVSQTPTSTDTPASGQTRTRYANSAGVVQVEAYSLAGVSHNLPVDSTAAIHFFGLDASTTPPTTPPPTSAPPTTAPPTTAPPTTAPPTTAPPSSGTTACSATFTVGSVWNSGFTGTVRVTAGSAAISKWTVGLTIPGGTTITNLWNGQLTGTSVSSASYNGSVVAGGSTEFGFQGSGSPNGLGVSGCTAT
jgi:acetylxylan esterase